MAKIIVAGELYYHLDGQLLEIKRQIRQSGGYPFNPEALRGALQEVIEGKFKANIDRLGKPTLYRLYDDEDIVIKETDGKRTLARAKDTFTRYLDPDFKNWGTDEIGKASEVTKVAIYEIRENVIFAQMFGELTNDPSLLILEQDQIVDFCLEHRDKLRTGDHVTFFLFKVKGELFIARVYVFGHGLKATVYRFSDSFWIADCLSRVVVPQLG